MAVLGPWPIYSRTRSQFSLVHRNRKHLHSLSWPWKSFGFSVLDLCLSVDGSWESKLQMIEPVWGVKDSHILDKLLPGVSPCGYRFADQSWPVGWNFFCVTQAGSIFPQSACLWILSSALAPTSLLSRWHWYGGATSSWDHLFCTRRRWVGILAYCLLKGDILEYTSYAFEKQEYIERH